MALDDDHVADNNVWRCVMQALRNSAEHAQSASNCEPGAALGVT